MYAPAASPGRHQGPRGQRRDRQYAQERGPSREHASKPIPIKFIRRPLNRRRPQKACDAKRFRRTTQYAFIHQRALPAGSRPEPLKICIAANIERNGGRLQLRPSLRVGVETRGSGGIEAPVGTKVSRDRNGRAPRRSRQEDGGWREQWPHVRRRRPNIRDIPVPRGKTHVSIPKNRLTPVTAEQARQRKHADAAAFATVQLTGPTLERHTRDNTHAAHEPKSMKVLTRHPHGAPLLPNNRSRSTRRPRDVDGCHDGHRLRTNITGM